jgi:hypothetical protein
MLYGKLIALVDNHVHQHELVPCFFLDLVLRKFIYHLLPFLPLRILVTQGLVLNLDQYVYLTIIPQTLSTYHAPKHVTLGLVCLIMPLPIQIDLSQS